MTTPVTCHLTPVTCPCPQERLSYPDSPPQLQGREQENGLLSLIEYLTQVTPHLTPQ